MNTHSGLIPDSMLYHNIATIRRRLLTLLLALSLMIVLQPTRSAGAGAGEWTWMSGSDLGNQPGSYGVQGVPDSANTPGERYETVAWTDLSGNLWLFGGNSSINGPMNDLWRYQPTNGMWTWVGGSSTAYQRGVYGVLGTPAPGNVPGARWGAVSWIDGSGNLWLFGGYGGAVSGLFSYLNDLWRYDIASGQWTWMSGANTTEQSGNYGVQGTPAASNVPGARRESVSWVDSSGNLWLFGGIGFAASGGAARLNDLWRYDPTTGQWTWMSGANTTNQAGAYGVQGTAAAGNVPGARYASVSWTDGDGNLWLHGGTGIDSVAATGMLNDLWRYDPNSEEWTWVNGANTVNQPGVYGVQGVPSATNVPGARSDGVSWLDSSDGLWLFGGYCRDSANSYRFCNDLWRHDPNTGQWTWMSGAANGDQQGVYGIQGTPGAANVPGGRRYSASWTDSAGNLWLFGGRGKDGSGAAGYQYMNDLWRYEQGAPLAVVLASFDATTQPDHILVTWETVSELSNSGFNLYRGESDDWDSATLLSHVPSQTPGSAQGFAYSFADANVQPEQTVWYWLEDIDLSGTATLHGPVSARMQTPTAVTLTALDAGSPPVLPPVAAGIVALAVAAGFFLRRNLQSCPIDRVD